MAHNAGEYRKLNVEQFFGILSIGCGIKTSPNRASDRERKFFYLNLRFIIIYQPAQDVCARKFYGFDERASAKITANRQTGECGGIRSRVKSEGFFRKSRYLFASGERMKAQPMKVADRTWA